MLKLVREKIFISFFFFSANLICVIDEYIVPTNATVMIVTYMLHRDPNVYKNPDKYIPDRFLSENCVGRHPYSYIPFSAGPRNCKSYIVLLQVV
jgi:cytochrome P450